MAASEHLQEATSQLVERLERVLLDIDVNYTAEGFPTTSPERVKVREGLVLLEAYRSAFLEGPRRRR